MPDFSNGLLAVPASALPVVQVMMGDSPHPTINARLLHAFLEVGKDFSTWIKDRIEQYGFTRNHDYILTFPKIGDRRNVKITEYHLTLDMAKELAMVERNEKGRQARQYFIECERRAKAAVIPATQAHEALNDPEFLRGLLSGYVERVMIAESNNKLLTADVEEMKPKAAFADMVAAHGGDMVPMDFAKELAPALKRGLRQIIGDFINDHILFRRNGRLRPYQEWVDKGYLRLVESVGTHPKTGEPVAYPQVVITAQGRQWIADRWRVQT